MVEYRYSNLEIIIPSQDDLYRRIPSKMYWLHIKKLGASEGYIPPKIFTPVINGVSVEWERFTTPKFTRERYGDPKENGILKLNTGEVREIPHDVKHTPLRPDNIAHSDILIPESGVEKTYARKELSKISEIIIKPPKLPD
ncbi:MAG: hypothetical protein GF311_26710 [Candidatus Lokiarchaeota archaeon]|nr:hypothetical protein [Candidatus Lokiarchaeota archaeon]